MNTTLKTVLINELIDRIEGGFVNNPNDSGGATKYGITQAVARANGFTNNMKDLPRSPAVTIYEKQYWQPLNLDIICIISPRVAEELFDIATNCGPGIAAQWFQLCLNAFNRQGKYYPDIIIDGKIGKFTTNCFKEYMNHRAHMRGENVMLKALNGIQANHYIRLAALREKDEEFVFGWIDKRIEL